MNVLALDKAGTDLAALVYRSVPLPEWTKAVLEATYTPDASVGSHRFAYHLQSGAIDRGTAPTRADELAIIELTRKHWQATQDLGQPRWHRMTLTVQRTGQFSYDFEYRDDYREGDVMRRP